MSSMIEYYQDRYASIENSPGLETEPTFRARVDYALRKIGKRSARILDFGCNTGSAARHFVEAGHEVVGVDISQSAIRIARRNVPQATFCQTDSESSVALPPASFDVCYCSEVIEHLFNVQGFVAEVHRLLKDGGMLVLTTPYHGWLKNLLVDAALRPTFFTHGRTYSILFQEVDASVPGAGRFPCRGNHGDGSNVAPMEFHVDYSAKNR